VQSSKWRGLAEGVGAVSIIAGLFLVAYELRQGHEFARAELSAESGRLAARINSNELDPAFAAVIEKSRVSPGELTRIERIQLNAHLSLVLNLYIREWYNYNRGFFENYTDFPRSGAARYFGTGYGKAYWHVRRTSFVPELAEVIDRYSQDPERLEFIESMDSQILDLL
jgi:hypothetical protein